MWIFSKKSFQYQIAEFSYHDKFWVEALQIEILLYIGYKDL